MKDIREVYVIFNTYTNGYYNGSGFGGILFAKQYHSRDIAVVAVGTILTNSNGVELVEIKKLYTL